MKQPSRIEKLKEIVRLLPDLPGVYQFLDASGKVIYVGKAKNLKKRVSSYFVARNDMYGKVKVMVGRIEAINHVIVSSESEALLLENNMIKNLQPRYNSMLKDDKTYPWIVVRNEPFPRVYSTRQMVRNGSKYFGPYASVYIQKMVLETIHNIHMLRTCTLNLSPENIAKGKYKVCLQYHIGNCKGPCVGLQSEEDYLESIRLTESLLKGETKATRDYLNHQMQNAAKQLHFEEAGRYKHRLETLAEYQSKSVVVSNSFIDADVFSLLIDEGMAFCNFMRIVQGSVVNSFTVELKPGLEDQPVDVLTFAMSSIRERIGGPLSQEVIVPFRPAEELFPDHTFTIPKRGDKLHLLELSEKNCRLYRLEKLKQIELKDPARHTDRILAALQKELHLPEPPRHIECFDNSNLQGTNPVASCVVFRDAKPAKKEYRHFNIKTVVGANDFASMEEIVTRRYTRLMAEGADLPQLIVVDGGKGQLSFAYEVLRRLGLEKRITIVGLAKRIEEVYFPNDPVPYFIDRNSEALKVLMHIRDEAHRFGITFHRQKRSLAFIKTELENIPTLGKKSVEKLLRQFRTISKIKKATLEELTPVVGKNRAREIIRYFQTAPESGGNDTTE